MRKTKELFETIKNSNITKAKQLMKTFSFMVNSKSEDGNTALIYAIRKENISLVKLLIEFGADVNLQNNNGTTPLMKALYPDYSSFINGTLLGESERLIESFKDSRQNMIDIAKILIEAGADINMMSSADTLPILNRGNKETVLMRNVIKGDIEVIKILMGYNPDIYLEDSHKNTCLHLALQGNKIEIAEYFYGQGLTFGLEKHKNYQQINDETHKYFENHEGYIEYRMINEE